LSYSSPKAGGATTHKGYLLLQIGAERLGNFADHPFLLC
jgi:hypothetical protein